MESKSITSSGLRKQENSNAYKKAPVAALFEDCQQSFERVNDILKIHLGVDNAIYSNIESSVSRFRQWGSDTGAPNRLLDHALRNSPDLRQAVIELLEDLESALQIMQSSLQKSAFSPMSPHTEDPNVSLDSTSLGRPPPSRSSSGSESSPQQLSDDIDGCVGCLLKLAPVLRDPASRNARASRLSQDEANQDIDMVHKMFPKATLSLSRRCGIACWKRKQQFLSTHEQSHLQYFYQRSNTDESSLAYDLHDLPDMTVPTMDASTAPATSHQTFSSPGSSGTVSTSVNDSIFSKVDYFGSRAATSVAESENNVGIKRLDVLEAPVKLESGCTFDCPYCGQEIIFGLQIGSHDDWVNHTYLDLEPYMCTFDDCPHTDRTYGKRNDWFQHELNHHRLRKIWICQSCKLTFNRVEDIQIHLSEKHGHSSDPNELALMVSSCENYSGEAIPSQACPFCGYLSATAQILQEHVGDHMEQLALASSQIMQDTRKHASIRDLSLERRARLEDLEGFVDEQRRYLWQPHRDSADIGSVDSNVAFAEDSDDESAHQDVHPGPAEPQIVHRGGRPSMQRRGDSWMTKVNSFLKDQPADQPGKEPWLSKVQTFLGTQTIEGPSSDASPPNSPIRSPVHAESSGQDPVTSAPVHCLRTRPPPRNKDFVGRDSNLGDLDQSLLRSGTICLLSGIGGIGKTDTAIEYTYRYERAYSYIFWVNAESTISCVDTYSLIATEFVANKDDFAYEQSRLITLGREFLELTDERWLLVFDHVTSWADIEQYIPTNHKESAGSILITSRYADLVGSIATPQRCGMELGPLVLEESRLLLLKAMLPNPEAQVLHKHPEYSAAGVIAKESEGLPLALSQIAGYVQVSECTLTDFIQLWNERRRHTKSSTLIDSIAVSNEKVLETIWNIGLREVTIDARELLNILAFLDSGNIQRKLLVGEHEELFLDFLHCDQSFRYKRMIKELSRRSMISVTVVDNEESLSIHRLLQQKILADLERTPRKWEEVFSQAFALVRKRFPLPSPIQVPEPAKWPACKEYLPHVLHLEKIVMRSMEPVATSTSMARLLSDGGINLWERGMTGEGLRLLKSAEKLLDKVEAGETLLSANINVVISLLIQDYGLGHVEESKQRSRKALDIRLEYLKQCDPNKYTRNDDILLHNAWSDFGCVMLQYNNFEEAGLIFRTCLLKYCQWGNDAEIPYEYYKYNHHSAFCRLYRHDFKGAIRLAEESLRLIVLATGQSSATSKTIFDLACIVFQSGDDTRALALHRQVLDLNLRLHGELNFLTMQSYYAVGALNAHIGNHVEAERCMRKPLELEQLRGGCWSEAANARTEFHLSQLLFERGSDSYEARELASRAQSVLDRLLPLYPLQEVESGDEIALFDHLQPVFAGRFVGKTLLKYVSRAAKS